MNAAELASFRALLQAQTVPAPPPDRGLFARMRSRLTVVDGGAAGAPPPASPRPSPRLEVVAAAEPDGRLADPPPSTPPAFGRRSTDVPPPGAQREPATPFRGSLEILAPPSTPDELDDVRAAGRLEAPPARPAGGVDAGWSRVRPPSAQRRLLVRLEAVLLAEEEGLEARRAAADPLADPAA